MFDNPLSLNNSPGFWIEAGAIDVFGRAIYLAGEIRSL